MTDNASSPRFTPLGKFVSLLLIIGLVAFGVYLVRRNQSGGADAADKADAAGTPEVVDVQVEVPKLSPPGAVTIKDNIVPIVYGLPGEELLKASARREVLLGGCIIDRDSPQWQCTECGYAWGARDR